MDPRAPELSSMEKAIRVATLWALVALLSPLGFAAAKRSSPAGNLALHAEKSGHLLYVEIPGVPGRAWGAPDIGGPHSVRLVLEGSWTMAPSAVVQIPDLAALRLDHNEEETGLEFEFRREVRDVRLFVDDSRAEGTLIVTFATGPGLSGHPGAPRVPFGAEVRRSSVLTQVSAAGSPAQEQGDAGETPTRGDETCSSEMVMLLLGLAGAAVLAWSVLARRAREERKGGGRIDGLNRRIEEELRRFEATTAGCEEG